MSERHGDKARFQRERQRKILRRERNRELRNARKRGPEQGSDESVSLESLPEMRKDAG